MKRFSLLFLMLSVFTFLLSFRPDTQITIRPVVVRVDIFARHQGKTTTYTLTDDAQMSQVLTYLRASAGHILAQQVPMPDPDNDYTIQVGLADGRFHVYQQQGDRFFRRDTTLWTQLNPDQGKKLMAMERQFAKTHWNSANS